MLGKEEENKIQEKEGKRHLEKKIKKTGQLDPPKEQLLDFAWPQCM